VADSVGVWTLETEREAARVSGKDVAESMKYYVRLVQGKGIISNLIEFKESDWPSHVELVECDDKDNPIHVLGSRYPEGIKLTGYDAYALNKDVWYGHDYAPSCVENAWKEMRKLIGRKYNLIDIFGIALDEDWHTDGRYICSEAVAFSFENSGNPLFNTDERVRRITPANFLLTPFLKQNKVVKWS
jgi:hypothetical protein